MENGIVLQLQAEALDNNIDVETLLRKAYLVARKLQLSEFEEWIISEQNGYTKKNVPDYRTISGEIKAWNPYHGWIPVVLQGDVSDLLSKMPMTNPIAAILDVYNGSQGSIAITIGGPVTDFLNENNAFPTKYSFHSSKAELWKIVSAVRNHILEWAILLEENGIIGENLRFTNDEMKAAHNSNVINNYTNNFYSSTDNTQIQQGGNIE